MSAYDMPPQKPGRPGHHPQQGYGESQPGQGMAITALVLGVLALLLCWTVIGGVLLGIPAFVLGLIAASRAKKGRARGRGMAIAGWVTGLLGVVAAVLFVVLVGTLFARVFNSEAYDRYEQCLSDADGRPGAVQQCADRLERDVEDSFSG